MVTVNPQARQDRAAGRALIGRREAMCRARTGRGVHVKQAEGRAGKVKTCGVVRSILGAVVSDHVAQNIVEENTKTKAEATSHATHHPSQQWTALGSRRHARFRVHQPRGFTKRLR